MVNGQLQFKLNFAFTPRQDINCLNTLTLLSLEVLIPAIELKV